MPTRSCGVPRRLRDRPLTMSSIISAGHDGARGLGVDRAGRDGVDPDVAAAELGGELLGEAVDPDLRQPVEAGVQPGGGRRLVHDRAAAAPTDVLVAGPGDDQRAVHVHGHEAAVVLPVDGEERVELHAAVDGGVVDEQVDATEPRRRWPPPAPPPSRGRTRRCARTAPRRPGPSATASPRSTSMSAITTEAPSAASARAYASPIPPAAPVTMATLPSNRPSRPTPTPSVCAQHRMPTISAHRSGSLGRRRHRGGQIGAGAWPMS